MKKKIVVLGATGFVGGPITRQLVNDGFSVAALTRNVEKARTMFGDTITLLYGSFEDVTMLEQVLADCDGVAISVPWQSDLAVVKNVTDILTKQQRTNVHVVYVSGATVFPENRWFPMIDQKLKAEETLVKSGVSYTILKPNWFMETLANFVRDGRATIFGKQNLPIHFLTVTDFSKAVSHSYKAKDALNKSFVLNGSSPIRLKDALQQYCDVVHPGMKVSVLPIWVGKMLAVLMKSKEMKEFLQLMAYFESLPYVSATTTAGEILGVQLTPFEDWLREKNK